MHDRLLRQIARTLVRNIPDPEWDYVLLTPIRTRSPRFYQAHMEARRGNWRIILENTGIGTVRVELDEGSRPWVEFVAGRLNPITRFFLRVHRAKVREMLERAQRHDREHEEALERVRLEEDGRNLSHLREELCWLDTA